MSNLSLISLRALVLGFAFLSINPSGIAQEAATPPVADPMDARFKNVTEDKTTPSLGTSHLIPVPTLGGFIDDTHPGYTVQLLQLQYRWGDPLDVYVMKPTGVKNPPVILNLYGYPNGTDAYKNPVFQADLVKDGFAAVGLESLIHMILTFPVHDGELQLLGRVDDIA